MKKRSTHYEILGVAADAPGEVIRAAFRAQMIALKKHPDLGGDAKEAALINEAHEVLSDAAKRKAYDASLAGDGKDETPAETVVDDRRRAPRYFADAPVSFCVSHDNDWHSARVTDFSVLGVRIRSHAPIKTGERVVIAPPNLASFAFHGTVKWARSFHPNIFERVYEAGIEFADHIDDIEQRLST